MQNENGSRTVACGMGRMPASGSSMGTTGSATRGGTLVLVAPILVDVRGESALRAERGSIAPGQN